MAVDRNDVVIVGTQMERELRERFREVAKRNGRSLSGEIRFMVQRAVEQYERRQQKEAA